LLHNLIVSDGFDTLTMELDAFIGLSDRFDQKLAGLRFVSARRGMGVFKLFDQRMCKKLLKIQF